MLRLSFALALAAALSGCATRFENQPLTATQVNAERRVVDMSRSDRPVILVAISGGGSRAAALGWVVLRELQNYQYTGTDGQPHQLLDEIAVVSSVSGGSVIAADFALYGAAGLDRFENDFLIPNNTRSLVLQAINPVNWVSLGFKGDSRSNLLEGMFDERLFNHKTFFDLNQPGKPYLILNATDMASGQIFAFTPQRFDDICSDLDAQPISTGVVASAAVPLLFAPIAFRNHSVDHCGGRPAPGWIAPQLSGRFTPYLSIDTFKLARYANDLRHGPDSFRRIDYLYFLDGGLADNLAIHGLLEAISSPYAAPMVAPTSGAATSPETILRSISTGRIRKLVVIVVNARADAMNAIDQSDSRPGILGMAKSVISVPIDSSSSSINGQLDALMAEFNAAATSASAGAGSAGNPSFGGLNTYPIEVDFDQLRPGVPEQRSLRDKAKQIPTLWTVTKPDLGVIEEAGRLLLRQHPCFQRLLLDLAVHLDLVDPVFAKAACPQPSDRR
jgi:NTE family protein